MRGRLINRFQAVLGVLDPGTTSYDSDFATPTSSRGEVQYTLPCQVEEPSWFTEKFGHTGLDQSGSIVLILHFSDLEKQNLIVPSSGAPLITIGTRVLSITRENGDTVRTFPDPPGMYVSRVPDSSFGLQVRGNPHRNLLFLFCEPRPRSM